VVDQIQLVLVAVVVLALLVVMGEEALVVLAVLVFHIV
tara:strand:- start:138 stop:251 length:114 start_codon:yes stop_codon:yes gene_type:complete